MSEKAVTTPKAKPHYGPGAPMANKVELIAEICMRLASGETMAKICRDPHMPTVVNVWRWAQSNEEVAKSIAAAREAGHDAIALEALEIVDGMRPAQNAQGEPLPPDATRDKARADVRLKLLAKWDPKRYGEAQQVRLADADGEKLDTAPLVAQLLDAVRAARTSEES